jgi:hypothetical protein
MSSALQDVVIKEKSRNRNQLQISSMSSIEIFSQLTAMAHLHTEKLPSGIAARDVLMQVSTG